MSFFSLRFSPRFLLLILMRMGPSVMSQAPAGTGPTLRGKDTHERAKRGRRKTTGTHCPDPPQSRLSGERVQGKSRGLKREKNSHGARWPHYTHQDTREPSPVVCTAYQGCAQWRPPTTGNPHSTHPCPSPPRPSGESLPWAEGLQALASN